MENRLVKGIWIPIELWQDRSLCWNEKVLLMEVDSFTRKGQDCFFSTEYLSNFLKVSERSVYLYLRHLSDLGYITVTRFDGRRRFLQSNLTYCSAEVKKTSPQGCRNFQHNKTTNKQSSKEDNSAPFDFRRALQDLGVSEEVANEWLRVRRNKRATNSRIAFQKIQREIERSGKPADYCIRTAVEKSWCGFEAGWLAREEREAPTGSGSRHIDSSNLDKMTR